MAYVSNSDIETRLGSAAYVQLTDDAGSGSANEEVIEEARAGAEGEVDSYLARRYAVPIDLGRHPELAGILQSMALDLAEHRLRLRRPPVPAEATARRAAAIAWLKGVANGSIDLPAAVEPDHTTRRGFEGMATGEERTLTHGELGDF